MTRARVALLIGSTYASLLLGQTLLPVFAGVIVRLPFNTPAVRSTVEIVKELRARDS